MKRFFILLIMILLTGAANAQIVRSGSTHTRVVKEVRPKKDHRFDVHSVGLIYGIGKDYSFVPGSCGGANIGIIYKCNRKDSFRVEWGLFSSIFASLDESDYRLVQYSHWNDYSQSYDYQYGGEGNYYYKNSSSMCLSGTLEKVWNIKGGWNGYVGLGGTVGYAYRYYRAGHCEPFWSQQNNHSWEILWDDYIDDVETALQGIDLGMLGVAGTEVRLRIPLVITLEARPWLHVVDFRKAVFCMNYSLGLHYSF